MAEAPRRADYVSAAAALLWDHWQQGTRIVALPEALRPVTRAEGFAVQSQLESRSRGEIYGWKIAATSVAGQMHIGVDGPLAGRILRETVLEAGGVCPLTNCLMRVAEAEFAFCMRRTLQPRDEPFSINEVTDAVGSVHPAIEVPDTRYTDFIKVGAAQLIADNACAHRFVLGPAASESWRQIDLAQHIVTAAGRGIVGTTGRGANVLGNPLIGLTWLANELRAFGVTLQEGQVVTTGTCITPVAIEPGAAVSMDFGVLGTVSLSFTD
jgi:2-keto-4-pentenoate hydratase